MTSRLGDEIRALILDGGPIGVDRYMALCLGHPTLGYYLTRDPFGAAGDFTTAPETSQMFGELVGAWAAAVWASMGAPDRLRLVELGPGRGTLLADALRALRRVPPLFAALDLHLVETSPALRDAQRRALDGCGVPASWHAGVEDVPPGPAIVIANEFFDALPVRHYVKTPGGWRQRLVGLAGDALSFGLAPEPEPAIRVEAPDGAVLEVGLVAQGLAKGLAARIARDGGAALVIDYGYAKPAFAETLQAVRRHGFTDPLAEPGLADLSAHVDFGGLRRAAEGAGAAVHGPLPQGAFLRALGLGARAAALKARATPEQAAAIDAAAERLATPGTAGRPGMGELFKVLAIASPSLPVPPGFEVPPP
ncbi:class I SAM-dependent methyltransferase [Lichenibacterium dinghuense]|uniref:class I SAM-dependent methyltransferase n=1 Tax=Lichenibacterium dinghuense TaxID=2895977 RepID=UPI001F2127C1|nr:SAM-dependent methyltransferase [Lichenibacterium sp. 6Y81]